MIAVVHFSTGLASAEVAFRAMDQYDEVVLVTADTTVEDEDNWRFADEVWAALGRPEWVKLCDGRTPTLFDTADYGTCGCDPWSSK